ncbi:CLUMA_CG018302, isoform A [Clunio marinus]|uniref:CLUMA_CG018302, isoform A n=1 Tax=Clunio marinus TaxID=568069 RepID=A0A1J1IZG7_9DIPT|nr:CLUMA_CG018302, isoform A [Clunio marinus]
MYELYFYVHICFKTIQFEVRWHHNERQKIQIKIHPREVTLNLNSSQLHHIKCHLAIRDTKLLSEPTAKWNSFRYLFKLFFRTKNATKEWRKHSCLNT